MQRQRSCSGGRLAPSSPSGRLPVVHAPHRPRRCLRPMITTCSTDGPSSSSAPPPSSSSPAPPPTPTSTPKRQPLARIRAFAAKRVALFVEPSPFSHISGMKNRFECLIKGLREAGDQVVVVTPDPQPPEEFCGAKVVNVLGFKLPFYSSPTLLLSLGLSVRVLYHLITIRPQIIHVSSPGLLVFAATMYAKLLRIPLVVSYHTHIPEYIPKYTWAALVHPMWSIIRWCTRASDLTLVTSAAMKNELSRNLCRNKSIDVWQRGVDTEVFNPKFRNREMRTRMTDGHPDAPLLVYIGRLGAEKNLTAIKTMMQQLPADTRVAFVGDGPSRAELEQHFQGMPVVFMGMLKGLELSQAYASADIFVMPSESETLGFVVLEAMASGLAVVSVAAGGLTDIITQPGKTGYLYPSGDYVKAAQLIRQLIEDPAARQAMASAGRAEVEKFGWSAATKVLREQQYSRAMRVSDGKQRFRFMAIRVGLQRIFKRMWDAIAAFFAMLFNRVGYAQSSQAAPV